MKTCFFILIAVILIGLQVPAFADLTLPVDNSEPVNNVLPQPEPSAPVLPLVSPADQSGSPAPSFLVGDEPGQTPVVTPSDSFFKSEEDMRILNYQINTGLAVTPVPEPGSLFGLSAGFAGLFFQVRRMRKRS